MTKLEYLKLCIQNKQYNKLNWLTSIFSIISSIPKIQLIYNDLSYEANGYNYIDPTGSLVPISDAIDRPLFKVSDEITIDSTWLPFVTEPIVTTVGRLITNAVCIYGIFNNNLPYINNKFTVTTVEKMIAPLMLSDPDDLSTKDKEKIYVSDYISFLSSIYYITNLSSIIVTSATPKVMTKPEGLDKFMNELIIKYKGKLHDRVELINFENELRKFDDDYLKDEASYGLFISGKIKDTARHKLFLTIGSGLDFTEKTKLEPILTSLAQGWSLDPNQFKNMMNDIRYGSFSRGAETVKGGVTFKTLIRSTNTVTILDDDCGTTLTLPRVFATGETDMLVDRYIIVDNKPLLITDVNIAKQYADKLVQLRSPVYCKLDKDNFCSICTGKKISNNRDSLAILLTEISSIIITSALKIMHGAVQSTAKIDLNKHFN